jgi:hypothetical protein
MSRRLLTVIGFIAGATIGAALSGMLPRPADYVAMVLALAVIIGLLAGAVKGWW